MNRLLRSPHLPLLATLLVLGVLYATAAMAYDGFFSLRVATDLLGDNAFLGIAAVGMTLVILSGGIDLSVGAVLAFTTIFLASLIEAAQVPPLLAIPLALMTGTLFGGSMGFLIYRYELPPFLVTLGGMFFARGMAFVVSPQSIGITHPFYKSLLGVGIPIQENVSLPVTALIFLTVFVAGWALTHRTKFGKNVFAVGGNESSALLMGLPVGRTKIGVYAASGFCAAMAGVVATIYMGSGNPAMGFGLELDAIAAVVIGGTLLTGGVGSQWGTLVGVLIFGTIQTAIVFDGRLNSWWLRIAIGTLLLAFILFQRFLSRTAVWNAAK